MEATGLRTRCSSTPHPEQTRNEREAHGTDTTYRKPGRVLANGGLCTLKVEESALKHRNGARARRATSPREGRVEDRCVAPGPTEPFYLHSSQRIAQGYSQDGTCWLFQQGCSDEMDTAADGWPFVGGCNLWGELSVSPPNPSWSQEGTSLYALLHTFFLSESLTTREKKNT